MSNDKCLYGGKSTDFNHNSTVLFHRIFVGCFLNNIIHSSLTVNAADSRDHKGVGMAHKKALPKNL